MVFLPFDLFATKTSFAAETWQLGPTACWLNEDSGSEISQCEGLLVDSLTMFNQGIRMQTRVNNVGWVRTNILLAIKHPYTTHKSLSDFSIGRTPPCRHKNYTYNILLTMLTSMAQLGQLEPLISRHAQ